MFSNICNTQVILTLKAAVELRFSSFGGRLTKAEPQERLAEKSASEHGSNVLLLYEISDGIKIGVLHKSTCR